MPIRKPYAAGSFYPAERASLLDVLDACIQVTEKKQRVIGVLAPHAGYSYSGAVAGEVYSRIKIPETTVLLCPNHTGAPIEFSVWPEGMWQTPLGQASVNECLAERILEYCPGSERDQLAHFSEHAAEVHVPFLQVSRPDARIVPVVVRSVVCSRLTDFGLGLARAIGETGDDALIVASSDMTHFETRESASTKDHLAIDRMLEMDCEGLFRTVQQHKITMCGCGPAIIMMAAAKALGADRAELVRYATSGDTNGDYDEVVGYCGMLFRQS